MGNVSNWKRLKEIEFGLGNQIYVRRYLEIEIRENVGINLFSATLKTRKHIELFTNKFTPELVIILGYVMAQGMPC